MVRNENGDLNARLFSEDGLEIGSTGDAFSIPTDRKTGQEINHDLVFLMGFSFEGVNGSKVMVDLVKDPLINGDQFFITFKAAERSLILPLQDGPMLREVLSMLLDTVRSSKIPKEKI